MKTTVMLMISAMVLSCGGTKETVKSPAAVKSDKTVKKESGAPLLTKGI